MTVDIWELISRADDICGILSLVVSLIALWKVADIQKQLKIHISNRITARDNGNSATQINGNKNSGNTLAGRDINKA